MRSRLLTSRADPKSRRPCVPARRRKSTTSHFFLTVLIFIVRQPKLSALQPDAWIARSNGVYKRNFGASIFPNCEFDVRLLLARLRNKRVFRGNPGPLSVSLY